MSKKIRKDLMKSENITDKKLQESIDIVTDHERLNTTKYSKRESVVIMA